MGTVTNETAGGGDFSARAFFLERFAELEPDLRFGAVPEETAAQWQKRTRGVLSSVIGLRRLSPVSLSPKTTERVDAGTHWRERVVLQTGPGRRMPIYVLIPKTGEPPYPTVIAVHGHAGGGKAATAGVEATPETAEAIRRGNLAFGRACCEEGFLVLCPDAQGFGERQEPEAAGDPMAGSCQILANMALPFGLTVLSLWVWDLKRLIDYAALRPTCDSTRLACAGFGAGGYQCLFLAALDTRGHASIVSGCLRGARAASGGQPTPCACAGAPALWEHMDLGDVAGLIAPRPLLVQTGRNDPRNGPAGLDNVTPQLALAGRVYQALDAAHRLEHAIHEGGHVWDNARALPFLHEALER